MLFSTKNLTIGYRKTTPVLRDINVHLEKGQRIALLGANGSGKSTLVKTISGLLPPLSGHIHLDPKMKISLVPQMKNLKLEFPMSIYDSLVLSQSSHLPFWKKWKPNQLDQEILDRTGVKEIQNLLLRECSGGQLQKFLIARSLLSGANLLFLDEPMDALDSSSQQNILDLFLDIQKEKVLGLFMITHNISKNWLGYFHRVYRIVGESIVEDKFT
ncbi:MAG: ATP-binding cassette domain-containing protein [Leptospira sp.]|nr:ATP-binding cassette domain-containing protein [Leptospira sp.]